MKALQRLYRTVDDEIVFEGDERAAFLLASEGDEVPAEYRDKVPNQEEAEGKATSKPSNKAVSRPRNKAADSE